ncbi:transposase [Streptomyces cinereoruber]|uniref:transposase n=1 Tax=Streptomyces cinereoruber TaxID=67260 RepID=UPI003633E4C0
MVIRPQGGGCRRAGDGECLAAIVFVATSGGTWRQVPPLFGLGPSAPGRPGTTRRPGRAGLVAFRYRLGECPGPQRGLLTGPDPTDRSKKGSKIHLITDRSRLPVAVAISAANTPRQSRSAAARHVDTAGPQPLRSRRRGPDKHGDEGYDYPHPRQWLRGRGIAPRIARRGTETSQRLGRHRWVVERTMSWLAGCRRLHSRYEHKPEHFLAFRAIATCRRTRAWPRTDERAELMC